MCGHRRKRKNGRAGRWHFSPGCETNDELATCTHIYPNRHITAQVRSAVYLLFGKWCSLGVRKWSHLKAISRIMSWQCKAENYIMLRLTVGAELWIECVYRVASPGFLTRSRTEAVLWVSSNDFSRVLLISRSGHYVIELEITLTIDIRSWRDFGVYSEGKSAIPLNGVDRDH
jgi:hypothetical protein